MDYMTRNTDLRLDPRLLVPGARTVISVAMNYFPAQRAAGISLYAQGKDYHDVVRKRLNELMEALGVTGRCFVDTAPVMERYWAWRSGLGWIGLNHQLIVPKMGSTFFFGELIVEEEADAYDSPLEGNCGRCGLCIEACPAKALTAEGLDARRCLSYLTIEHRGAFSEELVLHENFYGCDRCQIVCPHMRQATPTTETAFLPSEALLEMTQSDWQQLTIEQYQELFRGSAVKRAKYEGVMRDIAAWKPRK